MYFQVIDTLKSILILIIYYKTSNEYCNLEIDLMLLGHFNSCNHFRSTIHQIHLLFPGGHEGGLGNMPYGIGIVYLSNVFL